jgi:RNA polymerase sigma factor (sigma-70 family)
MKDNNLLREPIESQLSLIRKGDGRFLRTLYESKRPGFVGWFQKTYGMGRQQAIDLFQNAFSAFYFNVKDGKIVVLKSTIDTYIFGIGKIMMKETFRKEAKLVDIDELLEADLADYSIFHRENETHDNRIVRMILDKLEDPCKTLLTLYYFRNFSLESIAESMGYKNQGVVKKKKCLCLKSVRSLLIESKLTR